jgi:hypothetical protein
MNALRLATLCATVVSVACCAKPELTNRYSAAEFLNPSGDTEPSVSISVFTLGITDQAASTTIATLSDRGQSEAIKALAAKNENTNQFLTSLATPISPSRTAPALLDRTRFKRRIVVSLKNASTGPADRIAEANVVLEPE